MASTAVGGAIAGIGRALMRREDIARENALLDRQDRRQNELMDREDARQNALLDRQEARDDLIAARQAAIERAREIRQNLQRSAEREDDQRFQREQLDTQLGAQRGIADAEAGLQRERWSREDRRALEEQTTEQMAALDKRIQDLRDMALKGEVLGNEGEIDRQVREAEDQKLALRSRLVERLYEMGDVRYKDMPADQRLYAAGYSKDQVARFMRLAEGTAAEAPSEEAAPATAPVGAAAESAAAGERVRGMAPETADKLGLSDADRQVLGLPPAEGEPSAAMSLPESPPPLRDMSQAGRGRKAFGFGARESLRADTPIARIADALTPDNRPKLNPNTPIGRLLMGGESTPKERPPDPEEVAAKNVLSAMRNGFNVDTMKDIQTMRRLSPSKLRALGYTEDEIRRAKKQPPYRRP